MSGVYIKGGRAPISCCSCWHSYEGKCGLLGMDKELPWKGKRKDCPIIELPDHGRLKDTDKLKEYVNRISTNLLNEWDTLGVLEAIDKQPTLIEADI